jgi:fused signal recognition particle receptor
VISLCRELGLSVSFVGTGEKLEDLEPFDRERFLDALVARE